MYEAVRGGSTGSSTASRLALTAAEAGFDGLLLCRSADAEPEDVGSIRKRTGIDVADGIELRVDDPSAAAGRIGAVRQEATVLLLRGGTESLDRYAVGQERIDVLAGVDPDSVDMALLRTAARTGVHMMVDLGPVLRTSGGDRSTAIRACRRLVELLEDTGAPFVVSADARSHLHLRTSRDLRAVGAAIGIDPAFIERGLCAWGELVARNRERRSPEYVAPGVRRREDGA